jgi:hypothetical protein
VLATHQSTRLAAPNGLRLAGYRVGTGGVESCRSLRPASTFRCRAVQRLRPSGEESRRWRDRHGKEGSPVRVRQRASGTALQRGFFVSERLVTTSSRSGRRHRWGGGSGRRQTVRHSVLRDRHAYAAIAARPRQGTQWAPFHRMTPLDELTSGISQRRDGWPVRVRGVRSAEADVVIRFIASLRSGPQTVRGFRGTCCVAV